MVFFLAWAILAGAASVLIPREPPYREDPAAARREQTVSTAAITASVSLAAVYCWLAIRRSRIARLSPLAKCQCGCQFFDKQPCPECGRTYAQAAALGSTSILWTVSVLSLISTVILYPGLRCGGGHIGQSALPITGAMAAFAWWPFLFARESRLVPRALAMIAVVAASMVLVKNICDVLWFGHNPIL